jgi:hypothetical protein
MKWRNGDFTEDPPRPPHPGCPTCRHDHSGINLTGYSFNDVTRFVAEKQAQEAEKQVKIAAAAAAYAARVEAQASTLAIRIEQ